MTSFSTTIFIPFNFKSKEKKGNFPKQGFKIDDVLEKYFKKNEESQFSFLKIGRVDEQRITEALVRISLRKSKINDISVPLSLKYNFFKSEESFQDKKYVNTIRGFYQSYTYKDNENENNQNDVNSNKFLRFIQISNKLKISNTTFKGSRIQEGLNFKIGDINFVFNSNYHSIGYGFIAVNIDWVSEVNFNTDLDKIAKTSPIFRYFKDEKTEEFDVERSGGHLLTNRHIAEFSNLNLETEEKNIKISLRSLVEELLFMFLEGDLLNPDNILKEKKEFLSTYIDFEDNDQSVKPFYLYKVSHNSIVDLDRTTTDSIYKSLRIHQDSNPLNNDHEFPAIKPDYRSLMFFLSEGAFIIESETEPSSRNLSLERKYFLAFLFALNQKILFQFFQKLISNLSLDKNGLFDAQELRRLKGTLVRADFAQVFSIISDTNEIDLFFQNLRDKFKILKLREEFITSIDSIERIATLAENKNNRIRAAEIEVEKQQEKEAAEERRRNEERKQQIEKNNQEKEEKEKNDRIANFGIILAILGIYSGVTEFVLQKLILDKILMLLIDIIAYSIVIVLAFIFFFMEWRKSKKTSNSNEISEKPTINNLLDKLTKGDVADKLALKFNVEVTENEILEEMRKEIKSHFTVKNETINVIIDQIVNEIKENKETVEIYRKKVKEAKVKVILRKKLELEQTKEKLFDYELITVNKGSFTLGKDDETENIYAYQDEMPVFTLLDEFKIGVTPVTINLWINIMGNNPLLENIKKGEKPLEFELDCPVVNVSWEDVQKFIKKLNDITKRQFRLPSEAEWEFAAKGGNLSQGFDFPGSHDINEAAHYVGNSEGKLHVVGKKKANELGLYDMGGNVWEWCQDPYTENHSDPKDNNLPTKVIRGGSYDSLAEFCTATNRFLKNKDEFDVFTGFRLVEEISE
jgi:formylglycine-generating enzyme required for sulfatase activity